MPRPALSSRLFRRREIWLPTPLGALLLLALCGGALAGIALVAYDTLACDCPAGGRDGHGARALVVEGWLDQSGLDQAVVAFRQGRYERVLTTGGPIKEWQEGKRWRTFADRAASYLRAHGLASVPLEAVPAPDSAQDRTFLSAVMVREWAQRSQVRLDSVDVFSLGVHTRRSRLLFELALGDGVEVGGLAATPTSHDPVHWWRSSVGVKTLVMEAVGLAWTHCCFWPPPPGSHDERWGPR